MKTLDKKDLSNPFVVVNEFLKKYPSKKLAEDKINLNLVNSILSKSLSNFELTQNEFDILIKVKKIRFDLPFEDKSKFIDTVGKNVRSGARGIAGAYIFTNKENQNCYVGSSFLWLIV